MVLVKKKIHNYITQQQKSAEAQRGFPTWTKINSEYLLEIRSSWDKYLGGKAPHRQTFLYWWETNGPELHLTFLRLHLVYLSIQITILCFVFAPLILKHYGHKACWIYVLSPLPHVITTVAYIIGPLIRIVTEVGCVGVFSDNKVKKDVLRMMKTEKSMKGLVLLTSMKNHMKKNHGPINFSDIAKKPSSSSSSSSSKGKINMNADITHIAETLFKDKFDTMEEGSVVKFDFGVGIMSICNHLNDDELDIAFKLADSNNLTRLDLRNFIKFFKNFYTDEKWKDGLTPPQLKVGKKLHEAFKNHVDGGQTRLSAEEEYLRLKREHGASVLQIEEIFTQNDLDGNGVLDTQELKTMVGALGDEMTDAAAHALMDDLDQDGDGELSMAEFVVWAFHRNENDHDNHEEIMDLEQLKLIAESIFDDVFDTGKEKDGKIDVNEFIAGLTSIQSQLNYNEKHDLFREADENGSGYIDKEEFVALLLKYNE
jgi:Ca2+-binding EF-hand superfamily protein